MGPVFLGLLVVLTGAAKMAVAMQLEYTAAMADSSPDNEQVNSAGGGGCLRGCGSGEKILFVISWLFGGWFKERDCQSNPQPKTLKYDLMYPEIKVLLQRCIYSKGIVFFVKKGRNRDPSGHPGIKTFLKKSKKPTVLYLKEMHFEILIGRENKPCMKLTVQFHDNTKKRKTVEVLMHLYKPSKDEDNIEHAKANCVPIVPSPIPPQTLSSIVENKVQPENQYFSGDIRWMDEVLKRAEFANTKKKNFFSNYIETYWAGPVIIEDETAYNNILRLADSYEGYAS